MTARHISDGRQRRSWKYRKLHEALFIEVTARRAAALLMADLPMTASEVCDKIARKRQRSQSFRDRGE